MENSSVLRRFGIPLVGDIPWGTHLCQFYAFKEDLIDILVPYFAEGLKNNEFCMWVTSPPLEAQEATNALRRAVPDLDRYIEKGQIEILSYVNWYLLAGRFDADRVLQGWVEKEKDALSRGFAGLRLSGNTFWIERSDWKSFTDYEATINKVILSHRMIALCTYSLEKCTGADIVDVVRNHVGTLIRKGDVWSLVEDVAERKQAEERLQRSEERYRTLFERMEEGFSLDEIICDEKGEPYDVRYLAVNPAFERQVGLRAVDIIGKTVLELFPHAERVWLDRYGKVALTGEPARFEEYFGPLGRWYEVYAFRTEPGKFGVMFTDITERKKTEEAVKRQAALIDLSPDAILVIGMDGAITFWSKGAERLYGWTLAEAVGKQSHTLLKTKFPEPLETIMEKISRAGKWSGEIVHQTKDNREVIVESRLLARLDSDGKVAEILESNMDITERKKRENEAIWLASFPRLNPNPIIELDENQNILFANPAAESMFPTIRQSGSDHPFLSDLRHTVDALKSKKDRMFGRDLKVGDEWFYQQFYLVPETGHVRIYGMNVNESKRIENELRETSAYLDNLLNYANAPIIVWDHEFRITKFNRAFERLTGLTSGDVLGKRLDMLFPRDRREEALAHIKRTLEGEYWETVEIPILHVDGTVRTLLWNSANIYDPRSKLIVATIAQGLDITERNQAESQLRETRDYLDSLLNYANAPVIVWDSGFRITMFNHAFERLTGLSAEDVMGKPLDMLFPPDQKEEALAHIRRTLEGEYWEAVEIPISRSDGTVRTALWNSANIHDATGRNVIATIAQGQDITERKKLQEALKVSERMAAIGETASMVGHDLRNPLQAIVVLIGLATEQLQGKNYPSAKKRECLKSLIAIKDQTLYMNKIVSDLEDYAKPLKLEFQETDLTDLVKQVVSIIDVPETVQVKVLISKDLPKIFVDALLMRRVFTNLLRNALEAMPNGGKLIVDASQIEGDVVVNVMDTGVGIPIENQSKIFSPLFTTKSKGQGFGLPVCKRIIEAHKGSLTFESQVGKGSSFTLKLPFVKKMKE